MDLFLFVISQIFGKDIIDAMITEGMFLVMHQNGLLKLYSWDRMLKEVRMPQLNV